ncbi:MAG: alpha/beta hydrolase [Pseudomonadota bacterium]
MLRVLTMLAAILLATPVLAAPKPIAGAECGNPQPARCDGAACVSGGALAQSGNATDPATGRQFFLDFPCDLKPGEPVVFILNIHGAGSFANWQRHYFPASDYAQKYRLVVATPTAATSASLPGVGGPAVRRWDAAADDAHLQNIAELVITGFGQRNIRSFWLAGHSQGGATSRRIACSAYFGPRVDGFLSLSGGRVGQAQIVAQFGPPRADGSPPPPRPTADLLRADPAPICDYSHIYTVGQYEIEALPATSPLAARFGCEPRARRSDIADVAAGHVWDYQRAGYKVWGTLARPGTAEEYVYPGCRGGRVVADVLRLGKGHTEGLEPKVTEELVRLIVKAPGGKVKKLKG